MAELRLLYRDVDRTPYLFTLRDCARGYGLDLDLILVQPGGEWAEQLERGDVEVIAENYWGLQNNRAKGAPFITVGTVSNTLPERLLGDASVRSVENLRGKKLAVRATGPQALFPDLWLRDQGLAADVTQVVYPERDTGRWGHWQKVADGTCQACFVTDLYLEKPLAAGLHLIPTENFRFVGGNVTLTTSEEMIARRPADIQGLVSATFEANRRFQTDREAVLKTMRGEARPFLEQHFEIPDDGWFERQYAYLADELSDLPVPELEGLINAIRIQVEQESHLRDFNPLLMWDLTFAREALRSQAR